MENLPSREALEAELKRQGLPRSYAERLLAELEDHFNDLLEERNSTMGAARKLQSEVDNAQARLGEPTQLAVFAAEQYRERSFWGRHPWLSFVVLPLPLLVLGWAAICLGVVALGWIFDTLAAMWRASGGSQATSFAEENHPFVQAVFITLFHWSFLVVAPLVVGGALCRAAARSGLNWKWPLAACGLLSLVVANLELFYSIKTIGSTGTIGFSLTFDSTSYWLCAVFLPKFTVAMGIALLLIKRSHQREALRLAPGT